MDETFAGIMEVLATTPPAGSSTVRGTTYVHTRILRVGRSDEHRQTTVRIMLEGRPLEVPLASGLETGPFFDAAKDSSVVRVRLRAEWLHVADETPGIRNPVVTGVEERRNAHSGVLILEAARVHRVVTTDELPALLSSIDRTDDGEDL